MIDPHELKQFITILNNSGISYFVSGGIGLDGLRGFLSRKHDDIDIYLLADDLKDFFLDIKTSGYRCFRKLNKYEIRAQGIKADILPLTEETDTYYLKGNAADTRFPKEIFGRPLKGIIDGLVFPVAPAEIFALELPYSKYSSDKDYLKNIKYDKTLLLKISNAQKEKLQDIPLEEI